MKTVNSKMLFLAAVIVVGLSGLESCSKKNSSSGPPAPTPLGGFVSSDSVEPQALIAYWPMDGDANDHKGGITGTPVNISYTAGVRGQAYQGSSNGYVSFTPNAAFQGLQSYSVSLWFWQPSQPVGTPNTPQGMFMVADANTNPDLILENEHYAPVSGDSLRLHAGFYHAQGVTYQGYIMEEFDTAAIGKWVHFAMTYNGGTSTYVVYQDGVAMPNSSAFGDGTSTVILDGPPNATPASPLVGNLNFTTGATNGTIGTWTANTFGVSPTLGSNGCFLGKLDEIRVFNIALKPTDVAGLYLNGQAGR